MVILATIEKNSVSCNDIKSQGIAFLIAGQIGAKVWPGTSNVYAGLLGAT